MVIRVIVCVHNHLTTFGRPFDHYACLRLRSATLHFHLKQLSLFCLLWLISASADHIGSVTNFCTMVELLHERKNSSFQHRSIQAFHVSAGKKEI